MGRGIVDTYMAAEVVCVCVLKSHVIINMKHWSPGTLKTSASHYAANMNIMTYSRYFIGV